MVNNMLNRNNQIMKRDSFDPKVSIRGISSLGLSYIGIHVNKETSIFPILEFQNVFIYDFGFADKISRFVLKGREIIFSHVAARTNIGKCNRDQEKWFELDVDILKTNVVYSNYILQFFSKVSFYVFYLDMYSMVKLKPPCQEDGKDEVIIRKIEIFQKLQTNFNHEIILFPQIEISKAKVGTEMTYSQKNLEVFFVDQFKLVINLFSDIEISLTMDDYHKFTKISGQCDFLIYHNFYTQYDKTTDIIFASNFYEKYTIRNLKVEENGIVNLYLYGKVSFETIINNGDLNIKSNSDFTVSKEINMNGDLKIFTNKNNLVITIELFIVNLGNCDFMSNETSTIQCNVMYFRCGDSGKTVNVNFPINILKTISPGRTHIKMTEVNMYFKNSAFEMYFDDNLLNTYTRSFIPILIERFSFQQNQFFLTCCYYTQLGGEPNEYYRLSFLRLNMYYYLNMFCTHEINYVQNKNCGKKNCSSEDVKVEFTAKFPPPFNKTVKFEDPTIFQIKQARNQMIYQNMTCLRTYIQKYPEYETFSICNISNYNTQKFFCPKNSHIYQNEKQDQWEYYVSDKTKILEFYFFQDIHLVIDLTHKETKNLSGLFIRSRNFSNAKVYMTKRQMDNLRVLNITNIKMTIICSDENETFKCFDDNKITTIDNFILINSSVVNYNITKANIFSVNLQQFYDYRYLVANSKRLVINSLDDVTEVSFFENYIEYSGIIFKPDLNTLPNDVVSLFTTYKKDGLTIRNMVSSFKDFLPRIPMKFMIRFFGQIILIGEYNTSIFTMNINCTYLSLKMKSLEYIPIDFQFSSFGEYFISIDSFQNNSYFYTNSTISLFGDSNFTIVLFNSNIVNFRGNIFLCGATFKSNDKNNLIISGNITVSHCAEMTELNSVKIKRRIVMKSESFLRVINCTFYLTEIIFEINNGNYPSKIHSYNSNMPKTIIVQHSDIEVNETNEKQYVMNENSPIFCFQNDVYGHENYGQKGNRNNSTDTFENKISMYSKETVRCFEEMKNIDFQVLTPTFYVNGKKYNIELSFDRYQSMECAMIKRTKVPNITNIQIVGIVVGSFLICVLFLTFFVQCFYRR